MKCLFTVALASSLSGLIAQSDRLDGPLRSIAGELSNRQLVEDEAEKEASKIGPESLVNESLDFLFASNDANTEAAAVRFILALETFPFDPLVSRFKTCTNSTERAYTLHILNLGVRDHAKGEIIKKLAESVLYDRGAGLRRYGEARAYSSEGKRVCDVAYNVLVSRTIRGEAYPLLDVDNNDVIQRDQMIEKLGVELELPTPNSWVAESQSLVGPVPSNLASGKSNTPREAAKVKSVIEEDEQSSSLSRSVLFVLSLVTLGILWLLLRKRKNRRKVAGNIF
jgi:hypothetical protein